MERVCGGFLGTGLWYKVVEKDEGGKAAFGW